MSAQTFLHLFWATLLVYLRILTWARANYLCDCSRKLHQLIIGCVVVVVVAIAAGVGVGVSVGVSVSAIAPKTSLYDRLVVELFHIWWLSTHRRHTHAHTWALIVVIQSISRHNSDNSNSYRETSSLIASIHQWISLSTFSRRLLPPSPPPLPPNNNKVSAQHHNYQQQRWVCIHFHPFGVVSFHSHSNWPLALDQVEV